jgi:hypothetical protein
VNDVGLSDSITSLRTHYGINNADMSKIPSNLIA